MNKLITILLIILSLFIVSCQEKTIEVKYLANEGGYIEGNNSQTLDLINGSATTTSVTAIANEGYVFVDWSDGKTEATRFDTLEKSNTFTANFTKSKTVTVKYEAAEGGYIEGNTFQTGEGKVNTTGVKAIANEGYRFSSWDDGLTSSYRNDEALEDITFTALFKKMITVEFTCDSSQGEISGRRTQTIYEGMLTAQVYAVPKSGYRFVKWSTGETTQTLTFKPTENMTVYAIFERVVSGFPIISIDTNDNQPILSKEEYLPCSVAISNTKDEYMFSGVSGKIRGRGNSTWDAPKKPYKLKLNESYDLFGNGEAKTWTLIGNYTDLSLIRNYLACSVASIFDTQQYTSKTQFVDLYINGEYVGVYLLCEQNEVHSSRVNITETGELDTGYLIELDGRLDGEGFYVNEEFYSIKSPDTDGRLYTEEHKEFIKSYLEECFLAVSGDDYEKIQSLMDVESFAQAYIIYELFKSVDVGFASFYMYKDAGGKLVCGPVWDFDRSLGITGHHHEAEDYAVLWAKEKNTWFNRLLNHDEFIKLVSEQLKEYGDQIEQKLNECYIYVYENESSFLRNFEKWDILGTYVWPNSGPTANLKTWEAHVEFTREYLRSSLNYLKWIYIENL